MTVTVAPSLADVTYAPYWLDRTQHPDAAPPPDTDLSTDLLVVGGGYTGLWTALRAKERDPGRDVVVVEARTCGAAASGRNGGFVEASLTHGFDNGLSRWPDEMRDLVRLGVENLDAIEATVERYAMDCELRRTGELQVAIEPHHLDGLGESVEQMNAYGMRTALLDREGARARFDSPLALGAVHDPDVAIVDPGLLVWELRRVCLELGVRLYEHTRVTGLDGDAVGVAARCVRDDGSVLVVRADRVALGTNAESVLRRTRLMTVPVLDFALMTEPLPPHQVEALGWPGREGVGDLGNQFHYLRLTADDRILFGGYDAIYHYGSRADPSDHDRPETYAVLAEHFARFFPMLDGVRFSHAWGGVIDTSTRFCAFWGTALGGRVAYAAGFTGLGVAATRFAADVMLDRLDGHETERTALAMVRRPPVPFPPEPVRWTGIQATRWSLAHADAHGGRRNAWLRTLDRLGLGFDS